MSSPHIQDDQLETKLSPDEFVRREQLKCDYRQRRKSQITSEMKKHMDAHFERHKEFYEKLKKFKVEPVSLPDIEWDEKECP